MFVKNMYILCSDLESTLSPELWVEIAKETGIKELELTTRDISDLNRLMEYRLKVLKENRVDLKKIEKIIKNIELLEGADYFLKWARREMPVMILSDTFWEFINPLLEKMGYPAVFCNSLKVNKGGYISGFNIRENHKEKTINFLKDLGFETIAVGDSYNDIKMLSSADHGFLFNPSKEVAREFNKFNFVYDYGKLKNNIEKIISAT